MTPEKLTSSHSCESRAPSAASDALVSAENLSIGGSTVSLPDTPWKRAFTVAAVDSAQMLASSSSGCAAESSSMSAL